MKPFPHHYTVTALANVGASVELQASGLRPLTSAPPAEFDGPGHLWSPETLITGAVAGCFVLTFRAIASAGKLEWTSLACTAHATVDRRGGSTSIVAVELDVHLAVPAATDVARAQRLLEKAEKGCLVGNSLNCPRSLHITVDAKIAA